jgi:hypothetical protein
VPRKRHPELGDQALERYETLELRYRGRRRRRRCFCRCRAFNSGTREALNLPRARQQRKVAGLAGKACVMKVAAGGCASAGNSQTAGRCGCTDGKKRAQRK